MAGNENDSLEILRAEVQAWLAQGQRLEARLDALEAQRASEPGIAQAPPPPVPPLIAQAPLRAAAPPPLPRRLSLPDTPAGPPATSSPAVPSPLPPSGPGLDEHVWSFLRKLGPKEPMTWEMALGTYWLPRAAVLVLGIGVVWLMGFAINRFSADTDAEALADAIASGLPDGVRMYGVSPAAIATAVRRAIDVGESA